MGFGLLFTGYFVTYIMALTKYAAAFRLVGYALMSYALFKLSKYNRNFIYAFFADIALIILTAFGGASELFEYLTNNLVLSSNPLGGVINSVIYVLDIVTVFLFHAVLLWSIRCIAKETELPKIIYAAVRNFVIVALYFALNIIGILPLSFKESYVRVMALPLFIYCFVWIIMNLVLIFSCYARICDQNDVEMERKPSRFEFVNKYRAEMDRKQEKARRTAEEYKLEKINKRMNKKKK